MVNVHIRGIYSTALVQLFLENEFQIVHPSSFITDQFKLHVRSIGEFSPNLHVYDRVDRQGVNAVGESNAVSVFTQVLSSSLDDVVFRQQVSTSVNVEFPGSSKQKLDSIRAQVIPTLDGHHYYTAWGGRIVSYLNMAEMMLQKNSSREDVETRFNEGIKTEFPHEGSRISIHHVKIDGPPIDLGIAQIKVFEKKRIRLRRTFVNEGIYDGLNIRKDPGDYAVTDMKLGEWYYRTRYYSKAGVIKGTYFNINTPIELYPTNIRYVDLEVDVCCWPNGRIHTIDQDKFEKIISNGYTSNTLRQMINKKLNELRNHLTLEADNICQ